MRQTEWMENILFSPCVLIAERGHSGAPEGEGGRHIFNKNSNNNNNSQGLLSISNVPGTALSPCLLTQSASHPCVVGIIFIAIL